MAKKPTVGCPEPGCNWRGKSVGQHAAIVHKSGASASSGEDALYPMTEVGRIAEMASSSPDYASRVRDLYIKGRRNGRRTVYLYQGKRWFTEPIMESQ